MNWRPWRRRRGAEPERRTVKARGGEQFQGEVFAAELRYLADRWQSVDSDHPPLAGEATPSSDNNLVGLALSGGGIRSATFNLGMLQSLHRHGAFRHVDYLSTVSGGGFLGSSLSTLMSQKARRGQEDRRGEFPFADSHQQVEAPAVTYLRNNANYLAPNGLLDYLRILGVLVRGILLNFLVLMPLILVLSMIVILAYGQRLLDRIQKDDDEQRLGALLERRWIGIENLENASVASLTDSLENWSLLAVQRDQQTAEVLRWLSGATSDASPLIIGGPGDDPAAYRFRENVTPQKIVRSLSESGALQSLDALDEIEVVARAVEAKGGFDAALAAWGPPPRDGPESETKASEQWLFLDVEASRDALRSAGLLDGADEREPQSSGIGNLVAPQISSSVRVSELPQGLRRALHELYVRALYRPHWLEQRVRHPQDTPLAYWEFVELAGVRRELEVGIEELLEQREASANKAKAEAQSAGRIPRPPAAITVEGLYRALNDRRPDRRLFPEPPAGDDGSEAVDPDQAPEPPPVAPKLEKALKPVLKQLNKRRGAPSELGPTLDRMARDLYYGGLLDPAWFAPYITGAVGELAFEGFDKVVAEGRALRGNQGSGVDDEVKQDAPGTIWPHQVHAYLRYYEPPPVDVWDPYRLHLPRTVQVIGLGLIWIALFPLLLWLRRLLSGLETKSSWTRRALSCLLLMAAGIALLVASFVVLTLFEISLKEVLAGAAVLGIVYWLSRRLRRLKTALWWRGVYERSFSLILVGVAAAACVEALPYLIYHYRNLDLDTSWTVSLGAVSLVVTMAAGPAIALLKRAGKVLVIVVVGLLGPVLPALVFVNIVIATLYHSELLWAAPYTLSPPSVVGFFAVFALLFHAINLPLDINSTSLHSFYRDGLSRAYVIGQDGDEFRPEDDLSLREICLEGTGAPYHLINVALNLQGSSDPAIKRRHSDFFTFSRDHVGGARTGYCRTRDMERVFSQLQLSSAVAVSAAAAAPNMGTFTFGPLVVLMALLNIRLGFWLPNPSRVNRWTRPGTSRLRTLARSIGFAVVAVAGSFRARPGAYSLIKEMLSLMHDRSRFVNLSDGGHIENTGAYELLRRRCRFIIIGDAEADPQMRFGGLATLMRYARIDLGIEVEIHVDDLRLGADGQSRQHCSLGIIDYPAIGDRPAERGLLLYVKASLTGDEDQVAAEYQARSTGFPHESTADQSFNEGQFEAYRSLGFHIGEGLFDTCQQLASFEDFSLWFQKLRLTLSPGLGDHEFLPGVDSELAKIGEAFREPALEAYFYEIYPDLRPAGQEPAATLGSGKSFRQVFNLVGRQLRLMRTLFVAQELGQKGNLSHPSNRGWMNLFRRWAQAPTFKRVYLRTISTYSGPFQQFCESALGLGLRLRWRRMRTAELKRYLASPSREATETATARKVGQLMASVEGSREILHIGNAVLHRGSVSVELREGYSGTGMLAKAELELQRWAITHQVTLRLERALAYLPETDEDSLADLDEAEVESSEDDGQTA